MSIHADEEQLERLAHGERVDASMAAHVEACAECRTRLEAVRADDAAVASLLRHVDHRMPGVTAHQVATRARGSSAGWGRWAAGIALAFGLAGIAYAAPGSPLRSWLRVRNAPDETTTTPRPPVPLPDAAGLNAVPGARFTIVFATAAGNARAVVSLSDGDTIKARSTDAATTFTSESDDRWLIDTRSSAVDVIVEIPRATTSVEIRVGDRRVLLKTGNDLVTDAPRDASGRYVLPLRMP